MRIIVVTADEKLRDFCLHQLEKHDVDCSTVRTLGELFEELQKRRYSGLMIDLTASIKAGIKEKSKAHEALPLYPVLRLKWNKEAEQLSCLLQSTVTTAGISISNFIDDHCRPFKPRKVRSEKRLPLHLNVLISHNSDFQQVDGERSTTLDISPGGCSLFTTQQWELKSCIWLQFIEMVDQTPIKATIFRWTRWGTPLEIPSIGLRFESLTASQQQQLANPASIYKT